MLTILPRTISNLTQQAANGKFCRAKINFILAYKNWESYTKSFRLRKERDRIVSTRIKTQKNGIEFQADKWLTS